MKHRAEKGVLFLGDYRGRFAATLFNAVAGRMGLPWKAVVRALAPEQGGKPSPGVKAALAALEARGVRNPEGWSAPTEEVTSEDLEKAERVVGLNRPEHRPLLEGRFPAWTDKVEWWEVQDDPEAPARIEREVMDLTACLLGGSKSQDSEKEEAPTSAGGQKKEPGRKPPVVRLGRETKGRKGSGVTTVSDVPLDEAGLRELAARLKSACGTGGTVKDGRIEIQGDQRDRLTSVLEGLGYRVKRAGG